VKPTRSPWVGCLKMSEEKPLGTVHVAAVVVGAMVGVGIFFTPATLARTLPSPLWVLALWLTGGVVTVTGALVFADLSARYPHAGGLYVFLREGFGPRVGPFVAFLYGWQQLLIVQPGSMGIVALVLIDNLASLTGPLSPAVRTWGAISAIATFTAANLLGLRTGGRIQVLVAALKLGALTLLVAVGVGWGASARLFAPRAVTVEGSFPSWLFLGLIPVMFSFGGAYHGTFIAGSVRDPVRSVPRGIVAGVALVLVGYLGVNVAYLGLLGHDGLAASSSPAAEATALAFGPLAGKAIACVIVLSAAGILNTICLGFPFVVYAMARDGLFFAPAGKLDARTGRPALAVGLQGLLACVAVLVGSSRIDVLLMGIAFAETLFQAAIAIVHLRLRRSPGTERALPAPAIAPWTFLLIELGVAVGCLAGKPVHSAVGAGVLVVGAAAWFLWRRGG
jgi:basic amino acid/polyamine antiporter, APA family